MQPIFDDKSKIFCAANYRDFRIIDLYRILFKLKLYNNRNLQNHPHISTNINFDIMQNISDLLCFLSVLKLLIFAIMMTFIESLIICNHFNFPLFQTKQIIQSENYQYYQSLDNSFALFSNCIKRA